MFRAAGHLDRFIEIRNLKGRADSIIQLSRPQIQLIEKTPTFSIEDKLELLRISIGQSLTGEIYQNVEYIFNPKRNLEVPQQQDLDKKQEILDKLPFPYYSDKIIKNNRENDRQRETYWFQVSVNEKVSHFMKNYADELTEIEQGVLYGIPLSAIRAFAGLIEDDRPRCQTIAENALGGVPSKHFYPEELEYYEKWWSKLQKLSPFICQEFKEKHRKKTR